MRETDIPKGSLCHDPPLALASPGDGHVHMHPVCTGRPLVDVCISMAHVCWALVVCQVLDTLENDISSSADVPHWHSVHCVHVRVLLP